MIESIIGASLGASILGLTAWLVHTTISAVRGEARADVARADLAADLRIADENAESWQRSARRHAKRADAWKEIADAARRNPLPADATGLDVLSRALDFAAELEPVTPAGRRRDAGGGLPDPAVSAPPADDPGADDVGPRTMP